MIKEWTILKKELRVAFKSPSFYLLAGLFLFISGWIFYSLMEGFALSASANPESNQNLAFKEIVVLRFFANLNFFFIFLAPLLSMGSIAEEERRGSFDLLRSAPVSLWSIVLAKYLSLFFQALFFLVLTMFFPLSLYFTGIGELYGFFLGSISLLPNIMVYLGIGLLGSALTQSSALASLITFVFIVSNYLLSSFASLTDNQYLMQVYSYLSMTFHFEKLLKGILSFNSFCFYTSFLFLLLFLVKKVVESREW